MTMPEARTLMLVSQVNSGIGTDGLALSNTTQAWSTTRR
jgi:hypothetical protein